jgi:hypothetical protein
MRDVKKSSPQYMPGRHRQFLGLKFSQAAKVVWSQNVRVRESAESELGCDFPCRCAGYDHGGGVVFQQGALHAIVFRVELPPIGRHGCQEEPRLPCVKFLVRQGIKKLLWHFQRQTWRQAALALRRLACAALDAGTFGVL